MSRAGDVRRGHSDKTLDRTPGRYLSERPLPAQDLLCGTVRPSRVEHREGPIVCTGLPAGAP